MKREHSALTIHPLRRVRTRIALLFVLVAIPLAAAACGSSGSSASGVPTLSFATPQNGATVGRSFPVSFDTNQAIGDPSTGLHHIHLYYDGNVTTNQAEYDKVYDKSSFTVTRLAPGRHTIEAVLANADHSTTNVHSQITVTVSAAAPSATTPPTTTAPTGTGGYGY